MSNILRKIGKGTEDQIDSYFEDLDASAYTNLSIRDLVNDFKMFVKYTEEDND